MKARLLARSVLTSPTRPWRASSCVATALALVLVSSCRREPTAPTPPPASVAVSAKPIDRLAPGELEPGRENAFGLVVPAQMKIARRFGNTVYAEGRVKPEALANYVRERVVVSHVELGTARTVFPRATLRGGDPGRVFRIEVASARNRTELMVRDVTPLPAPVGLSEEERWRRAGISRDGRIDPKLD